MTGEIPKRPKHAYDDIGALLGHEHAVAKVAVEALSWIGTHGDDGNYASDVLAKITESGWQP